jgi:hypothetical protein
MLTRARQMLTKCVQANPGPSAAFVDRQGDRMICGKCCIILPRIFHCTGFSRHLFLFSQNMFDILVLTWIRDRCYDFKNIFAEKNCLKIGVFDSKQS